MAEYIDTSINPADYIEVWEVEDAEHGKQLVMAVDDLKCLPPADVRPVVRGRWEDCSSGWMCSNCSRNLDLTIRIDGGWFEVDVYEPESGECAQLNFPLSFDEHPEFNEAIGAEIYSWLSLWADDDDDE